MNDQQRAVTKQALVEYLEARGGFDEDVDAGVARYVRARYGSHTPAFQAKQVSRIRANVVLGFEAVEALKAEA